MLRGALTPHDRWRRDARAWARRDRIETLLKQLETDPPLATREDPTALVSLVAELREWWRRELAFLRDYPIFAVPKDWTRRKLRAAKEAKRPGDAYRSNACLG
jgi:hypothetical protein